MKKRTSIFLLLLALLLALTGCASNELRQITDTMLEELDAAVQSELNNAIANVSDQLPDLSSVTAEPDEPADAPAAASDTPVYIPADESDTPVDIPADESDAPVDILADESDAPVDIPADESDVPVEIPADAPDAPVDIPADAPDAPVDIPADAPDAPVDIPADESDAPLFGQAYSDPYEVAAYLHHYQELPPNFLTKDAARDLGWDNSAGNLNDVAPGKSIGGDRFGNREGLLPDGNWRECDVNYSGGYRGAERLVWSAEGAIYYTADHYESFTLLYGGWAS